MSSDNLDLSLATAAVPDPRNDLVSVTYAPGKTAQSSRVFCTGIAPSLLFAFWMLFFEARMCFFTLKVSRTSMFLWTCDFTHFVFLIFLLQTRVASGLFVFGPQHGLHRFFPPHVLTEVLRGFPLPPRLPGPRPGEEKRPQTPMPRTFDLRPTVPCDRVTVTPRSGGDQVRFDVKDPRDASRRGDVPRTRPRPRPGTWWLWQEARGSDRPPSMSRVFFLPFLISFFEEHRPTPKAKNVELDERKRGQPRAGAQKSPCPSTHPSTVGNFACVQALDVLEADQEVAPGPGWVRSTVAIKRKRSGLQVSKERNSKGHIDLYRPIIQRTYCINGHYSQRTYYTTVCDSIKSVDAL